MNDFVLNNAPYIFKLIDTYYESIELECGRDITVSYSNTSSDNGEINLKRIINIKFSSETSPDKYASDGFIDKWGKLISIEIYNKNTKELIHTISTDDHRILVTTGLFCDFTIYPNLFDYQLKYIDTASSVNENDNKDENNE